jgi:hypothetical protein
MECWLHMSCLGVGDKPDADPKAGWPTLHATERQSLLRLGYPKMFGVP